MNHTASPSIGISARYQRMFPHADRLVAVGADFGHAGGQKGMSWLEMLLMTGMNFAGGSEFAGSQFVGKSLPILLIATVTFMINSRHILMGAAIAPYMRDMPLKKAMPALFFYV